MKKFILALGLVMGAVLFTGCVPKQDVTINLNPEFTPNENVDIDFVELHNDATANLAEIENGEPFIYIADIDVSGSNEDKTVTVKAIALNGSDETDCKNFASAMLCMIGDAASVQAPKYAPSDTDSFGDFFNDYSVQLEVYDADNQGVLYVLTVPAGEEIPLNPNYETYIDEWIKGKEVYFENVVYDANGKPISED